MERTAPAPPAGDALARSFHAAAAARRTVLIPYLTAGFPDRARTPAILDAVAAGGADVIELGVPFSDPVADGPTIQRSSQIALEGGTDLAWVLRCLADFRRRADTPVVLFTYLNPVLAYGADRFLSDATDAGAAGMLLTDLPVGSDPPLEEAFERSPIPLVRLIAPTTAPDRAREIASRAQGFLYYISRMGVTGARSQLPPALAAEVRSLKAIASVPVAVGFGISTPEQAAAVGRIADGVVVGSALVTAIESGGAAGAETFVRGLRAGIDG